MGMMKYKKKSDGISPELAVYLLLILMLIIAQIVSPGYLSLFHVAGILRLASFTGIAAIGQNFALLTGGIDLSVAATVTFANIIGAQVMQGADANLLPALGAVLFMGVCMGLANGIGIKFLHIPPFVMTLGLGSVAEGIYMVMTNGAPTGNAAPLLRTICNGSMFGVLSGVVIVWMIMAVLVIVLLKCTTFGRKIYAVGANLVCAEFSGVRTDYITFIVYILASVFSAFAGFMLVGYTGTSFLSAGDTYTTGTISAVIIGGTAVTGGKGGYLGTIAGAVIMAVLNDLLVVVNISEGGRQIVQGAIIVLLVLAYNRNKK